jgi:hypothetical protein
MWLDPSTFFGEERVKIQCHVALEVDPHQHSVKPGHCVNGPSEYFAKVASILLAIRLKSCLGETK